MDEQVLNVRLRLVIIKERGSLTKKLVRDYQNGFPKAGEYVGRMDSR